MEGWGAGETGWGAGETALKQLPRVERCTPSPPKPRATSSDPGFHHYPSEALKHSQVLFSDVSPGTLGAGSLP